MTLENDPKDLTEEIARLRAANAELTRALAQMEQVALRDPLTGLFNRRHFLAAVANRIAHAARYGDQIALVFVDVDGLKSINDRYGHAAGDAVLIAIATHLSAETRESDVVARIGGDEFALLLDHVDLAAAQAKTASLSDGVSRICCPHGATLLPVSAAFGIAMLSAEDDAAQILERADSAMYRAKRADTDIAGPPPGA
jgi:diguanylate cyclase (GGDEF)-like protein